MENVEDCPDNENYEIDSDSETPKKRRCRTVNPSNRLQPSSLGMTKKRTHTHSNSVKPIPSTQLNVRQIEKQLSRGNENNFTYSIPNETTASKTVPKLSQPIDKLHEGCSSDSQTAVSSHQNRNCDRSIPKPEQGNQWSEIWRQQTTRSDQRTCRLDSKRFRLQSTSCIFDHNVNAGRSEHVKWSRDCKGKKSPGKVGRPPKPSNSPNNEVLQLPVIPVLKISLTDVRSCNDNRGDGRSCPSRYRVTPYPFKERCFKSSRSPRKLHRRRRTPTPRSGSESSCQSRSSDDRRHLRYPRSRQHRHGGKHRTRARSRSSSSSSSSSSYCKCRCCCSSCQMCKMKTHRRSRSKSEERKRRKSGSSDSCQHSRSNSDKRKSKPRPKETEKTRQSPDATKTVKNIIQRVSNAFNTTKESECSNDRVRKNVSSDRVRKNVSSDRVRKNVSSDRVRKNVSSDRVRKNVSSDRVRKNVSSNNDLEKQNTHVSRKSRSRSPTERQHHRKRPSTEESNDNNTMMCRVM